MTRAQQRWFAGFFLALPFLPSLVEHQAEAGPSGKPRRFVAFGTSHGGIWGAHMYPGDSALTESMTYVGRTIRPGIQYSQFVLLGDAGESAAGRDSWLFISPT
jgi:hypothetical protein